MQNMWKFALYRRWNRMGVVAVGIVCCVMMALPVHAFQGPQPPDADQMLSDLTARLNLTDDQVQKVKPMLENFVTQRNQIFQDNFSKGRGNRQVVRNEMAALHTELENKLSGVLSEEQMVKYKEYQAERFQQMKNKRKAAGMRGKKGYSE